MDDVITNRRETLTAFREFLGDSRFRRFAVALEEGAGSPLYWWQEQVLQEFQNATAIDLPRSRELLIEVFEGVVPHLKLAQVDVPSWCVIEFLGGSCPVQGWGTCGGDKWYFRARWGVWSIGLSKGAEDPVDIGEPGVESDYYYEEEYGDAKYSAGYMPEDEARYFIVRELTRFRGSQQRTPENQG